MALSSDYIAEKSWLDPLDLAPTTAVRGGSREGGRGRSRGAGGCQETRYQEAQPSERSPRRGGRGPRGGGGAGGKGRRGLSARRRPLPGRPHTRRADGRGESFGDPTGLRVDEGTGDLRCGRFPSEACLFCIPLRPRRQDAIGNHPPERALGHRRMPRDLDHRLSGIIRPGLVIPLVIVVILAEVPCIPIRACVPALRTLVPWVNLDLDLKFDAVEAAVDLQKCNVQRVLGVGLGEPSGEGERQDREEPAPSLPGAEGTLGAEIPRGARGEGGAELVPHGIPKRSTGPEGFA